MSKSKNMVIEIKQSQWWQSLTKSVVNTPTNKRALFLTALVLMLLAGLALWLDTPLRAQLNLCQSQVNGLDCNENKHRLDIILEITMILTPVLAAFALFESFSSKARRWWAVALGSFSLVVAVIVIELVCTLI